MKIIIITVITVFVIVGVVASGFSYQETYDQNCKANGGKVTGFLICIKIHEDYSLPNDDKPSQWDFRTLPSYVIIPKSSALPDNEFNLIPKDITVYLGKNNTVTWINEDDAPSTLVANDGTWSTGQMLFGDTASVTFNETGVYHYHGTPHPWKVGSITVLEG